MGEVEKRVSEILKELGVPCHIKGYVYLRDMISMAVNDFSVIRKVIRLYGLIAKAHNDTRSKVERATKHAIEAGYKRAADKFAEYGFAERPVNSEFIATIADYIRLNP